MPYGAGGCSFVKHRHGGVAPVRWPSAPRLVAVASSGPVPERQRGIGPFCVSGLSFSNPTPCTAILQVIAMYGPSGPSGPYSRKMLGRSVGAPPHSLRTRRVAVRCPRVVASGTFDFCRRVRSPAPAFPPPLSGASAGEDQRGAAGALGSVAFRLLPCRPLAQVHPHQRPGFGRERPMGAAETVPALRPVPRRPGRGLRTASAAAPGRRHRPRCPGETV